VADTYRPNTDVIETDSRAVGEGLWALATNFVEAVAEFVELVTELFNKATLVKVSSALAMVMYSTTIGKEWAVEVIESR
jgi:hypothetical protein